MSVPLKKTDPAYRLLEQGRQNPEMRTVATVYKKDCYICEDPEFSLMGLPLCYPCWACGGHVAADEGTCDACGFDGLDERERSI